MTVGATPRPSVGAPPWLLEAGLFITLVLLVAGLLDLRLRPVLPMPTSALLAGISVHIALGIYDGRYTRWRTVTWICLVGGWFIAVLSGFLGYLLPWGQMSFRAATLLTRWNLVDPRLLWGGYGPGQPAWLDWLRNVPFSTILALLLDAFVVIDIAAMHAGRLRRWRLSRRLTFFAAAVFVAVALVLIAGPALHFATRDPSADAIAPRNIIPDSAALASYSILRAVPNKLAGIILMFVFLLQPVVAPWMRAWRFHAPCRLRTAWTLFWSGLIVSWLGLAVLGSMAPTDEIVAWSRALALYHFGFFLVLPFVLVRLALKPQCFDRIFE